MLKQGKVYIYEGDFWLIYGFKVVNRRRVYLAQKVSPNGEALIKVQELHYKRGAFTLTNVKVRIKTELKKKDHETAIYYSNIKECRKLLKDYAEHKTSNKKIRIAEKIFTMIGSYDSKTQTQADIRSIALKLGFKQPTKMYAFLVYLFEIRTTEKYFNSVKTASDKTLVKTYDQYQRYWKFIHGFSRKLDKLLEKSLSFYITEMRERGL